MYCFCSDIVFDVVSGGERREEKSLLKPWLQQTLHVGTTWCKTGQTLWIWGTPGSLRLGSMTDLGAFPNLSALFPFSCITYDLTLVYNSYSSNYDWKVTQRGGGIRIMECVSAMINRGKHKGKKPSRPPFSDSKWCWWAALWQKIRVIYAILNHLHCLNCFIHIRFWQKYLKTIIYILFTAMLHLHVFTWYTPTHHMWIIDDILFLNSLLAIRGPGALLYELF